MSIKVEWRGMTFGGLESSYGITDLVGWTTLPGGTRTSSPSSADHGNDPSPIVQGPRQVTMTGIFRAGADRRGALLDDLNSVLIPAPAGSYETETLQVWIAGVARIARVQLLGGGPVLALKTWASGRVDWQITWEVPDPRKYGPTIEQSVDLVLATSAAVMPWTFPVNLPAIPIGGQLTTFNPGTDLDGSHARYVLHGPQIGQVGVELPDLGRRVSYNLELGPQDWLLIDTRAGGAWLNGSYRPAAPGSSVASKMKLLPGHNTIRALGTAAPGGVPRLELAYEPAYWF